MKQSLNCGLDQIQTESSVQTAHAISSKAVATNQLTFLSVILARSAVTLSCHDKPGGAHKRRERSTSRPSLHATNTAQEQKSKGGKSLKCADPCTPGLRCGAACLIFVGGLSRPRRSSCPAPPPGSDQRWSKPWTCSSTDLRRQQH